VTLQFAPKGAENAIPYSPQRDLAYAVPPLVRAAVMGLSSSREPWIDDFMAKEGITHQQLGAACAVFSRAMQEFPNSAVKSPREALETAGFFLLDPRLQLILSAKIGQMVTGAWFMSIRDVTFDGKVPAIVDLAGLVSAAETVFAQQPLPFWKRVLNRLTAWMPRG